MKCASRNATQARSCIDSPLEVKVPATVLLRLADWCRQQLAERDGLAGYGICSEASDNRGIGRDEQGGSTCQPGSPPPRAP